MCPHLIFTSTEFSIFFFLMLLVWCQCEWHIHTCHADFEFCLLIAFTHRWLSHQWANYEYYLSHLFTIFFDFWKYFLVSDITVSNVNNIIIVMSIIIKTALIVIVLENKGRSSHKGYKSTPFWLSTCRAISNNNTKVNTFSWWSGVNNVLL